MTITELNNELTRKLKSFIKSEGFYSSGKLYNSIQFNCTFTNFKLNIQFDSQEYIEFLDNGRFIERFFEKTIVSDLIDDFLISQIDDIIS